MRKFIDWLNRKPKPKTEWKYVGTMKCGLTQRFGVEKRSIPCIAGFYMSEDGKRKVKILPDGYEDGAFKFYPEVPMWVEGGPFPDDFEPIEDILGEMLTRMIDAKLTGKDK